MELQEITIGKVNDFENNQMKSVSVGDGKEVLIVKIDNKFSALGAHCTHYGAPLAKGVLNGDTIICPWHHACFNAKTGDLKEPPAFESLPQFDIKIENENVIVKIPPELPSSRTPDMVKKDKNEKTTFVIIGAGAAGFAASQSMREAGFNGKIIMVTQENRTPYDRPNLSKDYLEGSAQDEWMPLRSKDFYSEYGIEILFNKIVNKIDHDHNKIIFDDGNDLSYNKLLIATGGKPVKLNIPGSELKNIFYLRSFDDSDKIIEVAKNLKKAVIIGSSFIGMESAYSLTKRGIEATVISQDEVPFEKTLGIEIGKLFQKQHEKLGVKFLLGRKVSKFEGTNKIEKIVLDNGELIEADFIVVGIGVTPALDFASNLQISSNKGIKVDKNFKAAENIFAAGDIASFTDWRTGSDLRIEHWRTAQQQGRLAGFNMAGKKIDYHQIPFFWTKQADLNLRYVGHAKDWDEIIFNGEVSSESFIAFYIKNNKVTAAAGNKRDKEIAALQALMDLNKMPEPNILKKDDLNLLSFLQ